MVLEPKKVIRRMYHRNRVSKLLLTTASRSISYFITVTSNLFVPVRKVIQRNISTTGKGTSGRCLKRSTKRPVLTHWRGGIWSVTVPFIYMIDQFYGSGPRYLFKWKDLVSEGSPSTYVLILTPDTITPFHPTSKLTRQLSQTNYSEYYFIETYRGTPFIGYQKDLTSGNPYRPLS